VAGVRRAELGRQRQGHAGDRQQHARGQCRRDAFVAERRRQQEREQRKQAEDQRRAPGADVLQAEVQQRDQHRELPDAQGSHDGKVFHS
jgi:hypothetical protein